MCHNSSIESSQIEKFIENGMPQKIVKTVMYTMKKRGVDMKKQHQREPTPLTQQQITNIDSFMHLLPNMSTSSSLSPSSIATTAYFSEMNGPAIKMNHKKSQPLIENSKLITTASPLIAVCPFTGRFRKISQDKINTSITCLDGNSDNATIYSANIESKNTNHAEIYVDALAVSTQLTKQFARRINCTVEKLQTSKIYTILTKTTQPAHLIAVFILSFVLLTVWPDLIEKTNLQSGTYDNSITEIHNYGSLGRNNNNLNYNYYKNNHNKNKKNTLVIIAYLGAFAIHFGAQIWMTFVSGLSLYFSLPRHTFGQCQQILFPKYFAINSILSIGMLIMFVKYFMRNWLVGGWIQLVALTLIAFIEVIVRLYLAPPMLRLMLEKYKIEGSIGSGKEIGSLAQGDLVQCPHYQRIHKSFRRIHMTVAIGNMIVLLATCQHLYFLASKIQIS